MARSSKTATVKVMVEGAKGAAGDGETGVKFKGSPLFERDDEETPIDRISVIRREPIEEGHVGWLEPDATEDDIFRRFGGGLYRLQGKGTDGQNLKGAFKTIQIGGEPKFESKVSMKRYARWKRQELDDDGDDKNEAERQPSVLEMIELQDRKAERARAAAKEEYDRREAEREAAHKREMERLRLDAEARREEQRREDERRERDRELAEQRRREDGEAARARDREFFAGMIQLQKETSTRAASSALGLPELLSLLTTAKDLFEGGGAGAGSPDAVTALMQNLPAILDKSQGIASQLSGGVKPAEGGEEAAGGEEGALTLTGVHAERLGAVVENLRAQGLNPDVVLLRMFNQLARAKVKRKAEAAGGAAAAGGDGADQAAPAEPSRPGPKARSTASGSRPRARAGAKRPLRARRRR